MAMNRNRRRHEQSTNAGFWSNLLGRKPEESSINQDQPDQGQPESEPGTGMGQWQWEDVSRHITFIIYCTFLLLIYIANAHKQESGQRKILSTRQDVEDLKAEYILLQSEVMYLSRRTEVLDRLQSMGMGWKSPQDPPIQLDAPHQDPKPKKKGA
jgi:cell division protein FtsL